MLSDLSGKTHIVMTGVCILSKEKEESFDDTTSVTFQSLTPAEIEFYVDNYRPYDKAGAYGAQDWIGLIAIEKIVGSYFNVMGLPMHKVYQHLKDW
jgi:septum formation protein